VEVKKKKAPINREREEVKKRKNIGRRKIAPSWFGSWVWSPGGIYLREKSGSFNFSTRKTSWCAVGWGIRKKRRKDIASLALNTHVQGEHACRSGG